jgi:hypothetical protein
LKEAYAIGAKEENIIKIAGESYLQERLNVINVLELIGIPNKQINYEYQHRPIRTNNIKT